jgi:hypothetical protein
VSGASYPVAGTVHVEHEHEDCNVVLPVGTVRPSHLPLYRQFGYGLTEHGPFWPKTLDQGTYSVQYLEAVRASTSLAPINVINPSEIATSSYEKRTTDPAAPVQVPQPPSRWTSTHHCPIPCNNAGISHNYPQRLQRRTAGHHISGSALMEFMQGSFSVPQEGIPPRQCSSTVAYAILRNTLKVHYTLNPSVVAPKICLAIM